MDESMVLNFLPEDEFIDEILIYAVPEMNGHNKTKAWSVSIKLEIRWKGQSIRKQTFSTLSEAILKLPAIYYDLKSTPIFDKLPEEMPNLCFQPGCDNDGTHYYQLIKAYSSDGVHELEIQDPQLRIFCEEHSDRGNALCEDCNENYEVLEQESPKVVPLGRKLPKLEKLTKVIDNLTGDDETQEVSKDESKGEETEP